MAAVDPKEQKRLFERLSSVREVVFGVQDGVLTTAGVLCGLSGAVSSHSQVALAALASTAAGALSMGAGAYLGTRAEVEVMKAELDRVREETAKQPYVMQEGLLQEFAKEGLSREASYRIVKLLSSSQEALTSTAEIKMYGLGKDFMSNPILDGLVMGFAFVVGALVPLLPYMLIPHQRYDLGGALLATAVVLFGVGYFAGWLAHRESRWPGGLRFMLIALGAAAIGYLIGLAISPLGAAAG
ncbi:MAG TPA: VIT1/CCC1 transporter family protein [Candidatus Binataceae bacterium]|nr:VIT1/CCC1 transporter family protein [Candidatus Binataceae bacterium]